MVGTAQSALLPELCDAPTKIKTSQRGRPRNCRGENLWRRPPQDSNWQPCQRDCHTSAVEGLKPRDLATTREGKVVTCLVQCDQYSTCLECWYPVEPLMCHHSVGFIQCCPAPGRSGSSTEHRGSLCGPLGRCTRKSRTHERLAKDEVLEGGST